jgi:anti-sigma regulatory factor (Ser/Thr protein kinase)
MNPDPSTPAGAGGHRPLDGRPLDGPAFHPWHFAADLPAGSRSVPMARRLVRLALSGWGLDDIAELAELLASELVTNSIAASAAIGGPAVRLQLTCEPCALLIGAWDANPARPELQDGPAGSEHGRGLVLVDALAARWGCDPGEDGGKTVYAVIARLGALAGRPGHDATETVLRLDPGVPEECACASAGARRRPPLSCAA